jgi:ABC-2 type transport system permease protein
MWFYAAVAWRTFRRYSTYRAAMAAGVFTQTVFGFILMGDALRDALDPKLR